MRHHAHIKTTIWDDPEFVALDSEAQRLYFQLLTQKKLTMVGVMSYTPRNWARGCADMTVRDIESVLGRLVDSGFVVVDRDTEELLIRTSVKHDPPRGFKSIKGMWNAWQMVDSKPLRRAILDVIDADVWDNPDAPPPNEAKDLLNTPYEAPCDGVSDGGSDARNPKPDSTNHQPPPPTNPHPEPDDGWVEFWNEYPRKVGKKTADVAWRNLNKTDRAAALEALPAHKRTWKGVDTKHIPHPTTWLHQRRWEDELDDKRGGQGEVDGGGYVGGDW